MEITIVEGQSKEMRELNKFLNSYLRLLPPPKKKVEVMESPGNLVEDLFSGQSGNGGIIANVKKYEVLVKVGVYSAYYAFTHPDFKDAWRCL